MGWKEALTIAFYQLGLIVLVIAIGTAMSAFFNLNPPSAMTMLAYMGGAQFFSMNKFQKEKINVEGNIWKLSWRASVLTSIVVMPFVFILLKLVFMVGEEFDNSTFSFPIWIVGISALNFMITAGVTAAGLKWGVKLARKTAERIAAKAAKSAPAP